MTDNENISPVGIGRGKPQSIPITVTASFSAGSTKRSDGGIAPNQVIARSEFKVHRQIHKE